MASQDSHSRAIVKRLAAFGMLLSLAWTYFVYANPKLATSWLTAISGKFLLSLVGSICLMLLSLLIYLRFWLPTPKRVIWGAIKFFMGLIAVVLLAPNIGIPTFEELRVTSDGGFVAKGISPNTDDHFNIVPTITISSCAILFLVAYFMLQDFIEKRRDNR